MMLHHRLALLTTVCLLPALVVPAQAERAGVTAAVNPATRGTPPGGAVRMITLGAHVFENERIKTDGKGLAQILLADGTTFTVGPNSDLTIDRFVYDPDAGTAKVTASLGKGVFRFIGGKTSKTKDGVALHTTVGNMVIRGAVVDVNLTPAGQEIIAQFDLVFGTDMTLTNPDGSKRVYKPGYSIIIGKDGKKHVVRTPQGSANFIQQALAGRRGTSGGSPNIPNNRTVGDSGVPGTNSEYPLGSNTPLTHPLPDPTELAALVEDNATEDGLRGMVDDGPASYRGGFNAGIADWFETSGGESNVFLRSIVPTDTVITFNTGVGSLGGVFHSNSISGTQLQDVTVAFGDGSPGGASEFVNNDDFFATGDFPAAQASINGSTYTGFDGPEGYGATLVEAGGTVPYDPCTCDFLQWGWWDMQVFTDSGTATADVFAYGTWVAGDIPTDASFDAYSAAPTTNVNVSYTGLAIGTVNDEGFITTAAGDMEMFYDLGARTGHMDITNFYDGSDFSDIPLTGDIAGPLFSGSDDFASITGSFVNSGPDIGAGVIGNFSLTGGESGWTAVGIIAGERN